MNLIKTVDLHKIYGKDPHTGVHALRGVSIEIEEGEYVAIMGPSGSGKSTLMHIIGFLDTPTSGKYYFEGQDVSTLTEPELADLRKWKVGFVFQQFNLLARLKAWENVEIPMIYAGVPAKERKKRAYELLEMVGLAERAEHHPNELSGGEMQRVAIARALANNPKLILADEPTGNLDTKTEEEILAVFRDLHDRGKTIIVVTHDPEVAEHAGRIIHIRDGVIV